MRCYAKGPQSEKGKRTVIEAEQSGFSERSEAERNHYVLDSYALFTYFKEEEGADIVTDLIKPAIQNSKRSNR